jgi:hypothetical protein
MVACAIETAIHDNHHHTVEAARVSLRAFPYPYRAALAICSDIDLTRTVEEFLEIQQFLNTKQQTSMGEGVGLEIGNSFYFYDEDGEVSYFTHEKRVQPVILDLIQAGYLDCLHTYGDQANSREQILRALDVLNEAGGKVDVWVNHHGARSCISQKFEYFFGECAGDKPSSDVYHTDVTVKYGIRFAWVGATTRIIGQSARVTSPSSSVFNRQYPIRSSMSVAREWWKRMMGGRGDERFVMHHENLLAQPLALRDGQTIYEFMRYCNHPISVSLGATSHGLSYAISKQALEQLKAVEGYMIVYSHLGKNKEFSQVIAPDTQAALRHLEAEYRAGNIQVLTTSRLLNYHINHDYLVWTVDQDDQHVRIMIESVDDPVFGRVVPSAQQLQGITFYVPDSSLTDIYIQGIRLKDIQRNPADHTGSESVTIPFTRLTYPY